MNQQEINRILDELEAKAEKDIEVVFARRLKSILAQMLDMHRKFGRNGEATWTDVNKYNRFNQEMRMIAKELNADYKKIIKLIQSTEERLYIERYLLMAYLLQQSTGEEMGFKIPSVEVIQAALANPVEFLTLPKVFEAHRNDIIRRLNIEIAQSLQSGESYTDMAIRIENAMGWTRKKAILVARTAGGRVRSQVDLAMEEQACKTVTTITVIGNQKLLGYGALHQWIFSVVVIRSFWLMANYQSAGEAETTWMTRTSKNWLRVLIPIWRIWD